MEMRLGRKTGNSNQNRQKFFSYVSKCPEHACEVFIQNYIMKNNLNGINNLKCNRLIMSLWLPSTWWLLPATGEHYSALPISFTYTCTLMLSFCEENACRRCRNMHKGRNIKNGDYFQRGVAIGYLWVNEQTLKKWLSLGLIMRTRLCLRKAFVSLYIFSE